MKLNWTKEIIENITKKHENLFTSKEDLEAFKKYMIEKYVK